MLAYLDRPDVSGGEGLAGILRPGSAGSNTTADHVAILDMALAALPEHARPRPGEPDSPQVLIRTDAAGATHGFAAACRKAGCGYSLGFAIGEQVQQAILDLPEDAWTEAYDINGKPRDGAWVAELTGQLDLSKWPSGSRVIVRRERPHPGAQMRFTDVDGHRFTAFLTDTPPGNCPIWKCGTVPTPASRTASAAEKQQDYATCRVAAMTRTRCGSNWRWPPLTCSPGPKRSAWTASWPAANQRPCATGYCMSPHA